MFTYAPVISYGKPRGGCRDLTHFASTPLSCLHTYPVERAHLSPVTLRSLSHVRHVGGTSCVRLPTCHWARSCIFTLVCHLVLSRFLHSLWLFHSNTSSSSSQSANSEDSRLIVTSVLRWRAGAPCVDHPNLRYSNITCTYPAVSGVTCPLSHRQALGEGCPLFLQLQKM